MNMKEIETKCRIEDEIEKMLKTRKYSDEEIADKYCTTTTTIKCIKSIMGIR